MSCAVANAVMTVLQKENLKEHANQVGEYLLEITRELKKKHEIIGEYIAMQTEKV